MPGHEKGPQHAAELLLQVKSTLLSLLMGCRKQLSFLGKKTLCIYRIMRMR